MSEENEAVTDMLRIIKSADRWYLEYEGAYEIEDSEDADEAIAAMEKVLRDPNRLEEYGSMGLDCDAVLKPDGTLRLRVYD